MAIHNSEIADKFNEVADLLELQAANPFRIRAYRNAARVIEGLGQEAVDWLNEGKDLTELSGIGEDLAGKIKTIIETGELPLLQQLKAKMPATLIDMMRIPNLGPKRVKKLYSELKIKNLNELKKAVEHKKVQKLTGFGEKTEEKIKQALKKFTRTKKRIRLVEADKIATALVSYLKKAKGIDRVIVAGSYRRRKETVGDLDILVTAGNGKQVIKYFIEYDEVIDVISKGETRSTVQLRSGIHVDLRVVPKASYGAALHYFTGSKPHNIATRQLGVRKNLKINEYGVFKNDKRIAGKTEEEIYAAVDLPFIEPELREARGEIEAAQNNQLPKLIKLNDIRGDLHCHTKETDGRDSLETMVKAAEELGYEYLAITDHSKHLSVAKGLDVTRLRKQIKTIDKLNGKLSTIRILKAIECDILEDGTLDLPDKVLQELDVRICSVHYKFSLSEKKQTERIIRAMDNPYFNILGHPTGRLINKREAYAINLEKIIAAAKERGCFLEINAQPERLDLDDVYCKMAKEMGVKLVVSTDAHSKNEFRYMRFGVDQARRGWLEAKDVINTRRLNALLKLFNRK